VVVVAVVVAVGSGVFMRVERGPGWLVANGRWQDCLPALLAEVPDSIERSLITDPPYSARTHAGYRSGADADAPSTIGYASLPAVDNTHVVELIVRLNAAVAVIFSDHEGAVTWRRAVMDNPALYCFAPAVWCKTNPGPRQHGDGPASSVEHITVARRRKRVVKIGSLPGYYVHSVVRPGERLGLIGQKPIGLMRQIIRHYSRPGWCIVDPYFGTGTTVAAAIVEGRTAVACELDPVTFETAVARLRYGVEAARAPVESRRRIIGTLFDRQ
jgi:site-specific DNA-methyltransferase (adenine-specific)